MHHHITVIGAGLAGSEAAWQLAQAGFNVLLIEMKPQTRTPAQTSNMFAELVCSNSLRSRNIQNAVGLLKEEMAQLGSLIIATALQHQVPAGDALAVDRVQFGEAITQALHNHPRITICCKEVTDLPNADTGPVIVATGPLTGTSLANHLASITGHDRLYFYDAIAPIIDHDSIADAIQNGPIFAASRYNKGDGDDYLNCPMDMQAYEQFWQALCHAECSPLHDFEDATYFQGCLPIEVMAQRGRDALRFGPMKPVGLTDPRTGRRPYAVLQLRKEDAMGQSFNMVGFQTKLKIPEQKRVLRMIPGLQDASFLRFGAIHRNTYVDSPTVLDAHMRLKNMPHIYLAGQITGVEGYVESAAHGLVTAIMLAHHMHNKPISLPPSSCALGALMHHVRGTYRIAKRPYEPHNCNWSMFDATPPNIPKQQSKAYRVARAIDALQDWAKMHHIALNTGMNLAQEQHIAS